MIVIVKLHETSLQNHPVVFFSDPALVYGKYSSIAAEAIDEDIAQKAETCASKEMNEGAEYLLMKMMKSLWHLPKTLVLMEMGKR